MVESALRVFGGKPLQGEIEVQRAKNSILAMIAASIVVEEGETILHDVPDIEDVQRAFELLRAVGARVRHDRLSKVVRIDASNIASGVLPEEIASQFRGSVLFLAPLQARTGICRAARQRRLRYRHTQNRLSTIAVSRAWARMCNISRTDEPSLTSMDAVSAAPRSTWICPATQARRISCWPPPWPRDRPFWKTRRLNRKCWTLAISSMRWAPISAVSAAIPCTLTA